MNKTDVQHHGGSPSERKGPSPVMGSQVNGDGFKVCVVY